MSALDLAEPQALIHTPDSADGDWLHVVLLRRVKDAEWICLQPDASLVTWNLATHRIIALLRRAPFPDAVRGYVVEFQAPPPPLGNPLGRPEFGQHCGLRSGRGPPKRGSGVQRLDVGGPVPQKRVAHLTSRGITSLKM